ncbi:MAG: xanthine dehydrogenase family protein molybdopterin-binding subunit [Gammaproteobacteria bacterium]|nr:xanthine dehydrogenase family protein molybdopterin-binding subunit [Gammaproteobacteria bacterium]MBU1444241.1 xanthine dehydrogenase family protein molybdopterin-binding subunit [Gammaproteobacteria bacterium]
MSVGQPLTRIDGVRKVTGTAPYAYEHSVDRPTYLYPIVSAIARGRIRRIDASAAQAQPGVLLVMTHANAPRLWLRTDPELVLLQSTDIRFKGEFIGAVVAETPEAARHAASLVAVEYEPLPHDAGFRADHPGLYAPRKVNSGKPADSLRGDPEAGFAQARFTLDQVYTTPFEHHNPLEPHAVIALWHAGRSLWPTRKRLTLYDANQGPLAVSLIVGPLLGLLPSQIEVISPFVGGSFGSKAIPHPHIVLTAMAAKLLRGRAVKCALTRQQMFVGTGHRPASHQHIRLGADAVGRFVAIEHHAVAPTARHKEFAEQTATPVRMMYATPNLRTTHRLVPLDLPAGMFMRAPGEFTGMFALETAIDELAAQMGIDPIALRLANEPDRDPETGHPFSTRQLVRCLTEGARLFGWDRRSAQPGEHRDGEWRIGLGVASALYPNQHVLNTRAGIRYVDGRYRVELQASDIGTGALTILGQIGADALGVRFDQVDVVLGRSGLPWAMIAGGSMGTYTWGNSIVQAAARFRAKHGDAPREGARATAAGRLPKDFKSRSRHAFGAHFAQVRVSAVTGEVHVARLFGMYAAGRIINPLTARSQFIGGMTMGLGAALHEESVIDPRFGHVVNADLAGYHIASHADVPDIQAEWIDEFDPYFGPTGAKGIGEIGIVGVPAAIGNAIFNATGKRLRGLPFTPDKLLE